MQATTEAKISAGNWISLIVTMVVFAAGFLGWLGAAGGFGRPVEQQAAIPGIAYCSDVCVPTDLNGIEIPMHDGQFVTTGIFDGNFGGEAVWSTGGNRCVLSGVLTLTEVDEGARLCANAENVYVDLGKLWWLWKLDPMNTRGMVCMDIQHPEKGHCVFVDLLKDLSVSVQLDDKHYGPNAEG
jgi:hypothetical protein